MDSEPGGHGGDLVAAVLRRWRVRQLFTLVGGHISPILVGAQRAGIAVLDCRDERNAVFAADAVARLTGIPGVAVVTAGPGVTNTITALKNAQLAQSPLLLIGGATATLLRGRGALQDIDQLSLVRSTVKWLARCSTVGQLEPTLEHALKVATSGVPGPVFVEIPVDVLYPEATVRQWFFKETGADTGESLGQKVLGLYLKGHLYRQFHAPHLDVHVALAAVELPQRDRSRKLERAAAMIRDAERPALVVGSQTMVRCEDPSRIRAAVEALALPTWLGGMARGLLGRDSPIQFVHERGKALKEADVVIVCGFPFDFRLKYGMSIGRRAKVIAANLSAHELRKNRRPTLAVQMHPAAFLVELAARCGAVGGWSSWQDRCREREVTRDTEIARRARPTGELVDPVHFFQRLEAKLTDDAVLVADGGDFVATAAYVLRPRSPLSWLDPGVFGTLGVGGGFALGACVARPGAQVWIIYGDGSSAYSLAEFDSFVRHGVAPIAIVGTDASWAQIARDQVALLGSDVATRLRRTDYHRVAEGYGGVGLLLDDPSRIDDTLDEASRLAASGRPVCVNVLLAATDFRQGSISI